MGERSRGMGRGLAAILSSTSAEGADVEYRMIPVELQPVLVRPVAGGTYELIAGERRWRAAQLAGLETIPAVVRPHDDADSLELALIENVAREDLNPVEESRGGAARGGARGRSQ